MVGRVAARDLDLAVGPDRPGLDHVIATPAFDSPWVLRCAPDHPLARRRSLRWQDLHGVTLVAAGRDHERSVAQMHANAPEGTRIHPVDVVDNISTALGIAAQGLAATLARAYVGVVAKPMGLVMRREEDPEVIRQVCMYRTQARAIPPAADAFSEFFSGLDARQTLFLAVRGTACSNLGRESMCVGISVDVLLACAARCRWPPAQPTWRQRSWQSLWLWGRFRQRQ